MWIIWPFNKKNFGSARSICTDFDKYVRASESKYIIRDEKQLPHPKRQIFNSICILLHTETNRDLLETTQALAFELAFFQKDVGDQPLYPFGIDLEDVGPGRAAFGTLPEVTTAKRSDQEKYDRFKRLRDTEWDRMKATIAKIPKMTQARP